MTYLVERLAELRRHLDHLVGLRERVSSASALESDLSLHNDVLYSLLTICQLVIDIAGDLSARRGDRFEDYTQAVQNLARDERFDSDLVEALRPIPGFRNVLVHDYVALDLDLVVDALHHLEPIERFYQVVHQIVSESIAGQ